MKVKELIERLREMPQDARVLHLWDGAPKTEIQTIYLAKSGDVITSDYSMVCYRDEDRPVNAPTEEEDEYWETEKSPNPEEDEC
jgi:hypothetical protein